MLRSGVRKETAVNVTQILANTELFHAVGIVVNKNVGVAEGDKKIAKAGTPLTGNLDARATPFTAANVDGSDVKGILLHDVDVTDNNANATLLVFGFVNLNRIDSTTQGKLVAAVKEALPMISFMKY